MHHAPFAHLHVHSDYSLLSGAAPLSRILERVAELRQPAVALTDHANLFGAVEFYSQAMRMGIKPILGCEVFLCRDHRSRKETSRRPEYPQLLLLARTNKGWHHLMRLVSISYLEGFYYKPRIDFSLLEQYSEGLIALSSGWNGVVECALRAGDRERARSLARRLKNLFQPNCFFIELQRHGLAGQEGLNRQLIDLAHEEDIPLVATNNVHFLERGDFHAFEALRAVQQNKTLHDDLGGHYTPECYLKSYEEMEELFKDVPEALDNALHIACRCNVDLQFGKPKLPDFSPPAGTDLKQHLRRQAFAGLETRWRQIRQGNPRAERDDYEARLAFELDVIVDMGFAGYFLIVADFIRWAKKQGIPVGPGRGSGAGSLVAYCLGITDLDPIRYGLLFERFLNPERVSMPDFDVDFCMSRRDEVIEYVTRKYGKDHVAQIITFGSMKAKAVVRDVGRVLGMPYAKVDAIAKLIPNALNVRLRDALADEPRLQAMINEDDQVARLFDIALRLEGLHRHAGKHAAGVVISRKPLMETAPLYRDPREDSIVVQWDMKSAEKVGLVKFDFLGLKTLTILHTAETLIRRQGKTDFDLTNIPLDDARTYQLLQSGETSAVFQLESQGMRDLLTRIKPDCFEDIIALVALYRPGPLQSGMVDDFVERKHGRRKVVYPLPELEDILSETYGVILYQEQVMKIAQVLAGYTLGQADLLRRAMGKKKPEEMAKQREVFLRGAKERNISESKAEQIFDLMEKFAGYGFNKSHSAAYALIAYRTAYLKAHFPQAFMAATLTCDMSDSDKVSDLIRECRSMGIPILPPDINASGWEFMPEGDGIRFGLGGIKGVGEAAVRAIEKARGQGGPFASLEDLLMRVEARALNKRVMECLIKAGALDSIDQNRAALFDALPQTMGSAARRKRDQELGQSSLFQTLEQDDAQALSPRPQWRHGESLRHEHEVLGFYLSGHPLQEYLDFTEGLADGTLEQLRQWEDGRRVVLPVCVSKMRVHKGNRGIMAFVQVEDLTGDAEMVCFPDLFSRAREMLASNLPLLVAARVDRSRDEPALIGDHVANLEAIIPELAHTLLVRTSSTRLDRDVVGELKALLLKHPGKVKLAFQVRLPSGSIADLLCPQGLKWSEEVRLKLTSLFGADALRLLCRPWRPEEGRETETKRKGNHVAQLS